jgi:elongation factor Ts
MQFNINDIKSLREETGAGVLEVKHALESAKGDIKKAKEELMKKVTLKAAKMADRAVGDGLVYSYIHSTGKIGSMVVVGCETDFVARTDDFKKLCHEIAMQVCTSEFKTVEELNDSEYIRDSDKKIRDIVNEVTAKTGEKIEIKRFIRFSVGD